MQLSVINTLDLSTVTCWKRAPQKLKIKLNRFSKYSYFAALNFLPTKAKVQKCNQKLKESSGWIQQIVFSVLRDWWRLRCVRSKMSSWVCNRKVWRSVPKQLQNHQSSLWAFSATRYCRALHIICMVLPCAHQNSDFCGWE